MGHPAAVVVQALYHSGLTLIDDASHDGIVVYCATDLEEPLADLVEACFTIELDCIEVLIVDTEQKPFASEFSCDFDCLLHKSTPNAASLEAMKKIDTLQLIVCSR